jgi:SagB-type dehydrogenase family enzyme
MAANESRITSPNVRLTLGLRSRVAVATGAHGTVLLHPWGASTVQALPEVGAALGALAATALDDAGIAELVAAGRSVDDPNVVAALDQLYRVLRSLPMLVTHGVCYGSETLLTVEPTADRAGDLQARLLPSNAQLSLERFAYLRRQPEAPGLCLESPLALHRAQLGQSIVPLVARIAESPIAMDDVGDEREMTVIQFLAAAGLIRAGGYSDAEDERLATWSFHDLLFHARSRPGRSDSLFGAFFLHREELAAPAAIPGRRSGPVVDLASPQFSGIVASERTLTEVIESRSSVREYDDNPLTVAQLGDLLYRTARTRRLVSVESPGLYEGADHPYPTGGLAGDLEVYVSVARCTGLSAGIYHYESAAHRLRLVNGPEAAAPLLDAARMATGLVIEPQVLLTITARFARTAWKYESIAYALTLKHVGALLQTVYLVATSMGIGPCALGTGDAERAAAAFGLDWLVESSVGELALGSRAEPVAWAHCFTDLVAETRGET